MCFRCTLGAEMRLPWQSGLIRLGFFTTFVERYGALGSLDGSISGRACLSNRTALRTFTNYLIATDMMHTDFSLSIRSLGRLHPSHTGIYDPDMRTEEILCHEE